MQWCERFVLLYEMSLRAKWDAARRPLNRVGMHNRRLGSAQIAWGNVVVGLHAAGFVGGVVGGFAEPVEVEAGKIFDGFLQAFA